MTPFLYGTSDYTIELQFATIRCVHTTAIL